ncbi:hypothetical protein MED222_05970 [Vibrio sp. MED222]|nr:hypothetical protein MED222_05970 [Vibrio sp. MED222]
MCWKITDLKSHCARSNLKRAKYSI